MDTKNITKLAEELNKARSALELIEYEASLLNLNGHQQTVHIRIGDKGRSFSLAEIDSRRSYSAVAIRGTEMVMLGVKKLYTARIDSMKQRVTEIEETLRESAGV